MLQTASRPLTEPTLGHVANIAGAEVGDFIHVNPETIIRHQVMEGLQLLAPILYPSFAQKVREMRCSRPYLHIHTEFIDKDCACKQHNSC